MAVSVLLDDSAPDEFVADVNFLVVQDKELR
jgi:hypothetical protein